MIFSKSCFIWNILLTRLFLHLHLRLSFFSDPTNKVSHLFQTSKDCCKSWFSTQVVQCEMNIKLTPNGKLVHVFLLSLFFFLVPPSRDSVSYVDNFSFWFFLKTQVNDDLEESNRWYPDLHSRECKTMRAFSHSWSWRSTNHITYLKEKETAVKNKGYHDLDNESELPGLLF